MATPAQIRANRANARKGTGPRTAAGKARSSRNGLRHGFCSPGSFLAPSEHAAFARTLGEFRRDLRPDGPAETACVVEMVAAFCRVRLLDGMEMDLCQQRLDIETAFRKLRTLARYRAKPERTFYRALRQWDDLPASSHADALTQPAQTKICTTEANSPCKYNAMAALPRDPERRSVATQAPASASQPASSPLAPSRPARQPLAERVAPPPLPRPRPARSCRRRKSLPARSEHGVPARSFARPKMLSAAPPRAPPRAATQPLPAGIIRSVF